MKSKRRRQIVVACNGTTSDDILQANTAFYTWFPFRTVSPFSRRLPFGEVPDPMIGGWGVSLVWSAPLYKENWSGGFIAWKDWLVPALFSWLQHENKSLPPCICLPCIIIPIGLCSLCFMWYWVNEPWSMTI